MAVYAAHLKEASKKLASITDVPLLEAEILLAFVLGKPRSFLYARSNEALPSHLQIVFAEVVNRRTKGEPVAYITGHKEFWSLDLAITRDVLIPRPETELLVEQVLRYGNKKNIQRVADLGTGSGAIALALAKECPHWEVYATDQSQAALELAENNARHHGLAHIHFLQGTWYEALPNLLFDFIVSNPPYLAETDEHLSQGDLQFEPRMALVAEESGFAAIRQVILGASDYLQRGGYLLLEHGYQQGPGVCNLLTENGYQSIVTFKDLAGLDRVTVGRIL